MNSRCKPILSVLLFLVGLTAFAQGKVTGTVSDEEGEPLIGASVVVEGASGGVITDLDGRFNIEASPGQTICVSYVGYTPENVKVGRVTDYKIVLKSADTALDEVVVVGYGVQKKVNLTGSVASVDYARQAESRPITTAGQALAGASAGVNVLTASGKPGSEDITLRIRGIGTLNNSAPLILVDGFEAPITAVNPDDIASISILKDAASCAIYGNRGANGVVLITTKDSTAGKFTLSYNATMSVNEPASHFKLVSNYADYMQLMNESAENLDNPLPYSQSMIDLWREKSKYPNAISESGYPNYVAYPNTDWMDAMFKKNQIFQNHNVSAAGSNGGTRYLISFTFMDNPGVVEGTAMKRYQLRANLTSRLNKIVEIGTKIWGWRSDRELNDFDGASAYMSRAVPGIYPYYDGQFGWMENPEAHANSRNNLYFINRLQGKENLNYINATVFTNLYLPAGFTGHASFNYTRTDTERKTHTRAGDAYSFRKGETAYAYHNLDNLNLNQSNSFAYQWTAEADLNWNRTFGRHDVSAMAGFEAIYHNNSNLAAAKKGFSSSILTEMNTVTNMQSITGTQSDYASASFFGRVNYAYDERYLFEANLRYDGSSRFSRRSRWGTFPSFSAGWRINQEHFMESARSWLSNLKLRASWGKLGNNSIGNYDYVATYVTGYQYIFGGTLNSGMVATQSNDLLEWETTRSTDIGLDAGFLNNRLTAEIDWYDRHTSGILYRAPLHLTVGNKTAPYQNLCEVDNKGFEVTLGWNDRAGKVSYYVKGNFTRNWNRVSKYNGPLVAGWVEDEFGHRVYKSNIGDVSTGGITRTMEGKLINEFYLLNTYAGDGSYTFADGSVNPAGGPRDGMIRTPEDMAWLEAMIAKGNVFLPNKTVGKKGIWYGDYIYQDLNGDGIFGDANDYSFQNVSQTPKFYYGVQLGATWKGFDFSAQFAGAGGFSRWWYYLGYNSTSTRADTAIPLHIAENHYFYDPENPGDIRTNLWAENGRLTMNYGSEQNGGSVSSTLYLYKADYLKCKNITIGYTLPKSVLRKIRFENVRVFVSGENLFTVTDYPGMDPEFSSTSNYYASLRQWAFGLNVKF